MGISKTLIASTLSVIAFQTSAYADTPLKLKTDFIKIQGVAPSDTTQIEKIEALAYYSPAAIYDSHQNIANCKFSEDQLSPNDSSKAINLTAVRAADGSYALSLPATGLRGKCPYVLDSAYVNLTGAKVYEVLKVQTAVSIKKDNDDMAGIGGALAVPDFTGLKTLYCDFNSEYDTALCSNQTNDLSMTYGISNSPATYTLDIKDSSEKPPEQY